MVERKMRGWWRGENEGLVEGKMRGVESGR